MRFTLKYICNNSYINYMYTANYFFVEMTLTRFCAFQVWMKRHTDQHLYQVLLTLSYKEKKKKERFCEVFITLKGHKSSNFTVIF